MRILALLLLLILIPLQTSADSGVTFSGASRSYSQGFVTFSRSTGLQTNAQELNRFASLSSAGSYLSDKTSLASHATTARDNWSSTYTITPGAWESDNTNPGNPSPPNKRCEPVGHNQAAAEYEISYMATDIFAMALSGYIAGGTTSLYSAARTRLLELTSITDFESSDISAGNQCILDLGSAAPHIVEAAFLLEEAGYVGWTNADRVQLSNWLATEVFPLISWGIDARKNNWGIIDLGGSLAIAAYTQGGLPLLTKWNASTISPSSYISGALVPLAKWLSTANGDELDSDCQDASQVFGLQSYGGFPDELRRSVGNADCPETSLAFDSPRGDSTFYQQKTTNGLAHVCEILRRLDGNGNRCFDLVSHGGDDEALYDAAQFSMGATFQSFYLDDTTQGVRYVAGEYYDSSGLKSALEDGNGVSVRGGRDYAYTRITHAPGVAYIVTGGIAGVESACATSGLYGLGGNCICSEMFNEDLNGLGTGSDDFFDLPGSPDSHECWASTSTPTFGIETGRTISSVNVSAADGWGSQTWAESHTSPNIWAMSPTGDITSSTRTYCIKYFRQHSNPHTDNGPCRTKGIQMNFGAAANVQFTTQSDGGSCSTTPLPYWLQMSAIGGGTNYFTTVKTDECDEKPCKLELCADGNILAGTNLQMRARVTSYEGAGEQSTVTSATWNAPGGPINFDTFGGDWWHSGGGSEEMRHAMFSVWAWDSDTDQWPPDTVEIEPPGGAGSGVEERYASITAESNNVLACSEPMDGPNGESYTQLTTKDNSLSPNTSECWGRTSPGDSADWQNAAYEVRDTDPGPGETLVYSQQTIEPVTGWGSVTHASNQPVAAGDWWLGYKPSQLTADFGVGAATVCLRYYKQMASNYSATSDSCSGTTRNKLSELNVGGHP